MKTALAYEKKEWKEYLRTGKIVILGAVFVLFGLMNPAMAKLTPLLLEKFAEAEENGMTITLTTLDASMSWTQFYKNVPMALIVCCLLLGNTMTGEIQKGTLILVLTKGLSRWKIPLIKGLNLCLVWSIGYWVCYGITYFYTGYYWDNTILFNLEFAALCYWMMGLMILALLIFFSSVFSSYGGVIASTGAVYAGLSFLGIIPSIAKYLPTYLGASQDLLFNVKKTGDFLPAMGVTAVVTIVSIVLGCVLFNKKELC